MMKRRISILVCLVLTAILVFGADPIYAQGQAGGGAQSHSEAKRVTPADRKAAAANAKVAGLQLETAESRGAAPTPGGTPDYSRQAPSCGPSPGDGCGQAST